MATARVRLFKELRDLNKSQKDTRDSTGITLLPNEENVFQWTALLKGPADTAYASGVFRLRINVTDEYPMVPPQVVFQTRVFHPNVHFKTGEICLDILKGQWTPAWTLQSVCQAVLALMSDSAPDSPLNCDAGNLLRAGDVRGFNSLAYMYTVEHAMGQS